MSDTSPSLGLPLIQPAQAQKHVTHNEALQTLDAVVQLAVETMDMPDPPATVADGQRHIVPAAATGAWAGQDGALAVQAGGGWQFIAPQAGWRAYARAENRFVLYDGAGWGPLPLAGEALQNLDSLGVQATADSTNRLSVAAPATLLSHDGGDHRLTINKAAAADTASLLFQSGWTGHAEMGLTGGTDFTVRVSPDGAAFTDALRAAADTGRVTLPAGLSFGQQTLAHYEEGTWIPRLSFGGDDSGITYQAQVGFYTRIGQLVFVQCAVDLTARGTGTGQAEINDLPFDASPAYFPGTVVFLGGGSGLNSPVCRVVPGGIIRLRNTSPSGISAITDSHFTDATNLKVSITYMI